MSKRNFSIFFEKYGTARRFQEYDGVVVFQGAFETFESKSSYMSSYLAHKCDSDELDKRKKEAALLLGEGGFLCFLLTMPFIDNDGSRDFSATDLAKYHLNYSNLYRENYRARIAQVKPVLSEFKRFLDVFGAASSHFKNHNNSLDYRVLATAGNGDAPVGLILNRSEYFLPSLVPDARVEVVTEYFEFLIDAITSVNNKLHQDVPEWVASYQFQEEGALLEERSSLTSKVSKIDQRLEQLARYKGALIHSGPELVADVSRILEATFGITVDATDDFREDVKLIGKDGKVVCVCEIKGVNKGVTREHINQTDSHRERSGFGEGFPSLLIVNTHIKSARSINEKLKHQIATEQVKHAVYMRVLVIQTIDLLGLLGLVLAEKLTTQDALSLVLSKVGWLRVESEDFAVLSE